MTARYAVAGLPRDPEYLEAVADLLENALVRGMAAYPQHGGVSCLLHSVRVSYLSYRRCRRQGLDARAAARGGLLHDFFLYDWHTYRPKRGERLHGFAHPQKALDNAKQLFSLTPAEEDIILRHMWPLTWTPPATPEGWAVTLYDKYVSLLETLRLPVRLPAPPGGRR